MASPAFKVGLFAQTRQENVVIIASRLKNFAVGLKPHCCTGVIGRTDCGKLSGLCSALEAHILHAFAVVDIYLQPLRQSVYHTGADAVQAAGNFIAFAAELAAACSTV